MERETIYKNNSEFIKFIKSKRNLYPPTKSPKQKKRILKSRLKKLNININLDENEKANFKKLVCIKEGPKESFYYDNGTAKGRLIITFNIKVTNINNTDTGQIITTLKDMIY